MLNILTTSEEDKQPKKAHPGDACADIVATSIVYDAKYIEYSTGLKMLPDDGYLGLVFPRSSISGYDLILCNSVGVIDEYTGEWKIRFKRTKQPLIDFLYRSYTIKRDEYIEKSKYHKSLSFLNPKRARVFDQIYKLRKELEVIDKQIHETEASEKIYQIGDKIAQFMFLPKTEWKYTFTEKMPETTRGEKGFGSSDLKHGKKN